MLKTQKEARVAYADALNECYTLDSMLRQYPYWKVRQTPAQMMKFNDPTMYDCGFNDWIDGMIKDRQAPNRAANWCA